MMISIQEHRCVPYLPPYDSSWQTQQLLSSSLFLRLLLTQHVILAGSMVSLEVWLHSQPALHRPLQHMNSFSNQIYRIIPPSTAEKSLHSDGVFHILPLGKKANKNHPSSFLRFFFWNIYIKTFSEVLSTILKKTHKCSRLFPFPRSGKYSAAAHISCRNTLPCEVC